MHLRPAAPADLKAISDIYAKSWKHAYRGIVAQAYLDRLPYDYWIPFFSQRLDEGIYTVTVAQEGESLTGCVVCGPSREKALSSWGEICSLYVLPEWTGKGVGHLLLKHALEELRRQSTTHFFLWVLEQNTPARRFYERHGFRFEGQSSILTIEGAPLTQLRYVWRCNQGQQ